LPCLNSCVPDPLDTTVIPPDLSNIDKCLVQDVIGEPVWRECVPIVHIDSLRSELAKKRSSQGILFKQFVIKMEDNIQKIGEIQEK